MVTNIWEAQIFIIIRVTAYIGLCMSEDIGITTTCEGVEDTPITKVDVGITAYQTFEAASIDKLSLRHIRAIPRYASGHTCNRTFQIDMGAIISIVGVIAIIVGVIAIIIFSTDHTFLTTTEDLEDITTLQIDRCTTNNRSSSPLSTAKHI